MNTPTDPHSPAPFDTRQDCTNPNHGPGWHPGTPPATCILVLPSTPATQNRCGWGDCRACYPDAGPTGERPEATQAPTSPTPETIAAVRAAGIDPDLFAAYCSHQNTEASAESLSDFTANYAGTWDSERDYAGSWVEDLREQYAAMGSPVPEPFASYLGVESYALTMFSDVMFSIPLPHGNIAVFRTH